MAWQKSGESRLIFTRLFVILSEVKPSGLTKKALWQVLKVALILSLAGCDLFSTRPVEPPDGSGSNIYYPLPNNPDQLFLNMRNALAELNSQAYLDCFFTPGDPGGIYQFVPDPGVSGWPLPGPWGYAEESETIQYLFALLSPGNPSFLILTEESRIEYGIDDSVKISQTYHLIAPAPDLPPEIQEVGGQADFILARTDIGYWAILRWVDLHGMEGLPSWTALKAGLYSP